MDGEQQNSRDRGAISNAVWNVFGTLSGIVITFLLAPLLILHLGAEQWGLLLLVWSITGVLGIANVGVGEATLRFIAHYHADNDIAGINRVLSATLTFYLGVCTFVIGILFAATPLVASWIKVPTDSGYPVDWLIRLSGLLFAFGMIASAFQCIPMALHRYDVSSRVGVLQNVVRSGGVVALVLAGANVMHLVLWDVGVAVVMIVVHVCVARRLLPGISWIPALSLSGIREIVGYSFFAFATHVFLTIYRESGKLILASKAGPMSVAYLGTPDNLAYRLHMIVVSGVETLLPRFTASRDGERTKAMLVTSTWIAVSCGVILYLPLAVLMPDFLRLWINADFARQSGPVGQLLALSFIAPSAFSPTAALFRGIARPGFVTLVMALAGGSVLVSTLTLVPAHGLMAVGYAYVLSAIPWFAGLVSGWVYLYGRSALRLLLRVIGVPLLIGLLLGFAEVAFRGWWGELSWITLFTIGGGFAGFNALVILFADTAFGGSSPIELIVARASESGRIAALRRRIGTV